MSFSDHSVSDVIKYLVILIAMGLSLGYFAAGWWDRRDRGHLMLVLFYAAATIAFLTVWSQ